MKKKKFLIFGVILAILIVGIASYFYFKSDTYLLKKTTNNLLSNYTYASRKKFYSFFEDKDSAEELIWNTYALVDDDYFPKGWNKEAKKMYKYLDSVKQKNLKIKKVEIEGNYAIVTYSIDSIKLDADVINAQYTSKYEEDIKNKKFPKYKKLFKELTEDAKGSAEQDLYDTSETSIMFKKIKGKWKAYSQQNTFLSEYDKENTKLKKGTLAGKEFSIYYTPSTDTNLRFKDVYVETKDQKMKYNKTGVRYYIDYSDNTEVTFSLDVSGNKSNQFYVEIYNNNQECLYSKLYTLKDDESIIKVKYNNVNKEMLSIFMIDKEDYVPVPNKTEADKQAMKPNQTYNKRRAFGNFVIYER